MHTHTHRPSILPFIYNTHPFFHTQLHTTKPSLCAHTHTLFLTHHIHPYRRKQNTCPCSFTYLHSEFSPYTQTPLYTHNTPHTHICSAPPSTAATGENFYKEAEGLLRRVPMPLYPLPPQSPGLRTHLGLEKSWGGEGTAMGLGTLGCHSWDPPHSSMQGCPPG